MPALQAESLVELDAELDEIADPGGASPVNTATALPGTVRDRSVACSACSAAESSSATAAAIPPWASWLFDDRSGPFVRTRTSPSAAAHKAAVSPATPPPTTTRSQASW